MKQYKPGITCVTLSKEPFVHEGLPEHVTYLNTNQTFGSCDEWYENWVRAVKMVETETFFVQDHDDPLPNKYPSQVVGIYYGDHIEHRNGAVRRASNKHYHKRDHLRIPTYIHKAFCNTAAAHKALQLLPNISKALPEGVLYYLLANTHGRQYDPELEMVWINHSAGMHHQSGEKALLETTTYLTRNGEDILARLRHSERNQDTRVIS